MKRKGKAALCAVLLFFIVGWVHSSLKATASRYQTVVGTGPDKWASVWLIRSHLSSEPVQVKSTESEFQQGLVSFDTDSAELSRTGISTAYSAILKTYDITDPVAIKMGRIIHDIEINAWNPNREVESLQIENGFRQMQLAYGRNDVTQACYMAFFSTVAEAVARASITLETDATQFIPDKSCLDQDANTASLNNAKSVGISPVPELDLTSVLDSMNADKKVVFIDTREAFEFAEGHIPGAINLTLRQIDNAAAASIADADLVIAYCVKDFRGYEAARTLRKQGVNAAIMNPYGIKGWRNAGLPVAGSRALSIQEAAAAMQDVLIKHRDGHDETS